MSILGEATPVSFSGNTSGNTISSAGTLVIAGGSNVTLSGATAAGAQTISIVAGGGRLTTNTIFNGSVLAGASIPATSRLPILPFMLSADVTASNITMFFSQTMATSAATTVSGAATYCIGIYSADTANSQYVFLASASHEKSATMASSAGTYASFNFYTGNRKQSLVLNAQITLLSDKTYALAYLGSTAGSAIASFGVVNPTDIFFPLINPMENQAWGVSSGIVNGSFAFPLDTRLSLAPGVLSTSATTFPSVVAWSTTNILSTLLAPGLIFGT